ncbi:MAG: hypothetical protein LBL13_07015 [Bacteroidales bacterium]|jgi:transposase-like protein|nr:hypothetical protein [Bacteroidales bacterium]
MQKRYDKTIVKRICELIEKDSYTVSEICKTVGIADSTYYKWANDHVEFSDGIKKARNKFDENIVAEAKRSLKKLVNGYSYEETKIVYIEGKPNEKGDPMPKIKEQVKITKHVPPNLGATIFLLTNKAEDEWKNRQNTEISGNVFFELMKEASKGESKDDNEKPH